MIYDVRSPYFRSFLSTANSYITRVPVTMNRPTSTAQPNISIGPTGSA